MHIPTGALVRDQTLPDLGYGRVLETSREGESTIAFSGDEALRHIRLADQRDVVRARLHPGQRARLVEGAAPAPVRDAVGPEAIVLRALPEDPEEPGRTWRYLVEVEGREREVDERALAPSEARSDDPLERLTALSWDRPAAFLARAALLRTISRWHEDAYGIPPLLGARIHPLAHQIHAARRVLTDRSPRFVLADEVGLGKTIEAGLVAQALQATAPDLRVLVVAPGAMSRQWLCELFLRFGEQVFLHLDVARLEKGEPLGELLARRRVIVSTTALEGSSELARELLARPWDLVVVDEAHQVPPGRPLYATLRQLATRAGAFLALSATPGKRDEEGLLGLLALVDPEAHDPADRGSLAARLAAQERVLARLGPALELLDRHEAGEAPGEDELRALAARWVDAIAGDEVIPPLLARLREGDAEALAELVAYVQEYHRVERRIVRTRRATVNALGTTLAPRRLETISYKAGPAEQALVAHLEGLPDLGGETGPRLGLRGLYLRAVSTTPLGLLSLLEARKQALAARSAPPAKKGRGKRAAEPAPARPLAGGFDLLAALLSDPGPADEERLRDQAVRDAEALPGEQEWLERAIALTREWMVEAVKGCARFKAAIRWIEKHVGESERKVLVFCQDREVVEELATALADVLGEGAALAFHHGLEDAQLSDVALRFQQPQGECRVLVSDELGGEGRNFQLASAVVHLDQPWAVARLEQRIGRLDRIGRAASRPVLSVVLLGPSPTERALFRLHQEVFRVYEQSLGGLEFVLPRLQRGIAEAACRGAGALDAMRAPALAAVEEARAERDQAYERALDSAKKSLDEAAEQAEVLAEVDGNVDLRPLAGWAQQLGIALRSLAEDVWTINWSWEHLRRPLPGLSGGAEPPVEGRVRRRGTFSRTKALEDESLELFAPGHPVIDALARDAQVSREGRGTVAVADLGRERRGRVFLVVLGRTAFDADAWGELVPPPGLVYRAQTRSWPQVRAVSLELRPGQRPGAVVLKREDLLGKLSQGGDAAGGEEGEGIASARPVDRDELARRIPLAALWPAVREGVDLALKTIAADRKAEVEEAVERLGEDLSLDLGYLRGVIARETGPARARAEQEVLLRERLVASVAGEKVHLEALALVLGGP